MKHAIRTPSHRQEVYPNGSSTCSLQKVDREGGLPRKVAPKRPLRKAFKIWLPQGARQSRRENLRRGSASPASVLQYSVHLCPWCLGTNCAPGGLSRRREPTPLRPNDVTHNATKCCLEGAGTQAHNVMHPQTRSQNGGAQTKSQRTVMAKFAKDDDQHRTSSYSKVCTRQALGPKL